MKRRIHLCLTVAISLVGVAACGNQLQADDYRSINRLAREIENQARQIERETRHFRQTPFYFELLNDAGGLREVARQIRSTARQGCDLARLQHDIIQLGAAYRVLDHKFRQVERLTPFCVNARNVRRVLHSIQFEIAEMTRITNRVMIGYGSFGRHPQRTAAGPYHGHGGNQIRQTGHYGQFGNAHHDRFAKTGIWGHEHHASGFHSFSQGNRSFRINSGHGQFRIGF